MPNNKKILILEDDAALVKALSQALEKEGYAVLSALDGDAGFKLIEEEKPDLIILDIILPRKSGHEVMQEISKREELKQIPVVVLTNLESSQDVDKMMRLGAKCYLIKSDHSLEEVVEKVKESLISP
ncbi:response regulator [Patescibacteria group bacterium]|nr:response regulator [Patescibacteria group bacterium]